MSMRMCQCHYVNMSIRQYVNMSTSDLRRNSSLAFAAM